MNPYLPNTPEDRRAMLAAIGAGSVEELFADIPPQVRLGRRLQLPEPLSELELMRHLEQLASRNGDASRYTCFLGGGVYDHFIPAVVDEIVSRGEFYTSYTPYQAEISQGNLQAFYEFQTMICELTGMDVANASMYDGATAVAEAALMAVNATDRGTVLVARTVHPQYRRVLRTYVETQGLRVVEVPMRDGTTDERALAGLLGPEVACLIVQVPNYLGVVEPAPRLLAEARRAGALGVVAADPVSLGLLEAPGRYGADIVAGEGQSLGIPMSFGGPHFGFLAARQAYLRRMPGRIVGATVDRDGRRGYVLTLQTREQHIRREKATSNICTNHALMALAATVHMATLGPGGLRRVAELCLQKSHHLAERIAGLERYRLAFPGQPFFKEFAVRADLPVDEVLAALRERRILGGIPLGRDYPELGDAFLVAVTEKRTRAELDHYAACLEEIA